MAAARRLFQLVAALVLGSALLVRPASGGPSVSVPGSWRLQVTAFTATSTASFGWSCTKQPNNSGWARMQGKAEYTETMRHGAANGIGLGGLIIADKVVTGGATVATSVSAESHSVTRTKQHEPERCDSQEKQATLGGVKLESSDGSTVTVKWILTTQSHCMPPAQSADPAFVTHVAIGELKRPMIRLRGHGTVPLSTGLKGSAPAGAQGYKSHGSLHWKATITLKKLKPSAGAG